ncbi:hypothetical protein FRC18_006618 [Serendipita sp. 400]|nr:hypothetical protein FRC18_006618 [Serendipita sp. 400]
MTVEYESRLAMLTIIVINLPLAMSCSSSPVSYHRLEPKHAAIYRVVRLCALSASPAQFSSTFEREITFDAQTWTNRLSNVDAATFIASKHDIEYLEEYAAKQVDEWARWNEPSQFVMEGRELDGVVTVLRSFEDPKDAFLVSFWVNPGVRRRGIGTRLVEEAIGWARGHDLDGQPFTRVVLDVLKDNVAARSVYERCGFEEQGDSPEDAKEARYNCIF